MKIRLLLMIFIPICAKLEGQTAPTVGTGTPEGTTSDLYFKASTKLLSFFSNLEDQKTISKYTTLSIYDQFDHELYSLKNLESKGRSLGAIEDLIKERLDCIVFIAAHSQESARDSAVAVASYLINVNIFLHSVNRRVIADKCVLLMEKEKGSLIAVPLYYYARIIGRERIDPPSNLNVDKALQISCESMFKNE